jgi:hypothetical protein
MRLVLDFDTPRCAANSSADFTGNEIETAFDIRVFILSRRYLLQQRDLPRVIHRMLCRALE